MELPFSCPSGTQTAPGVAAPRSRAQCVPLLCPPPLRPSAWAPGEKDELALNKSLYCVGCGVGTVGAPGGCQPCRADELCPGLGAAPLWNFSTASGLGREAWTGVARGGGATTSPGGGYNSRASPWAACPRLGAPPRDTAAAGAGANLIDPRYALASAAAGALLLLLMSAYTVVGLGEASFPAWARALLKRLDRFAIGHNNPKEGEAVRNLPTPLGGIFSLLGVVTIVMYASYISYVWWVDNALVQQSLASLSEEVWVRSRAVPWADFRFPGLPSVAAGSGGGAPVPALTFVARLLIDGAKGACAAPLAPPFPTGLARGAWVLVDSEADCGGSGLSQLTYGCLDCELTAGSALSLLFDYSCQSALLEVAAMPAGWPLAAAPQLLAAVAAAAPNGGALLSTAVWRVEPELALVNDSYSKTRDRNSNSLRGYGVMRNALALSRPPLSASGGFLSLQPNAAAVNFTFALPLSTTYVSIVVTERTPLTQLLSNILGLLGLMGAFGAAFSLFETSKGCLRCCGVRGGKNAAPLSARARAAAAEDYDDGGSSDGGAATAAAAAPRPPRRALPPPAELPSQGNPLWAQRPPSPAQLRAVSPPAARLPQPLRGARTPFTAGGAPVALLPIAARDGGPAFERVNPQWDERGRRQGSPPRGTRTVDYYS